MFEILMSYIFSSSAVDRKQEERRDTFVKHKRAGRAEQERDGTIPGEWSGRGRDAGYIEEENMESRSVEPGYDLVLRKDLADAPRYTKQNGKEMEELRRKLDSEEQQSRRLRRDRDSYKQEAHELGTKLEAASRGSNVLKTQVCDLQDQLARYKSYSRGMEDRLQGREKDIKIIQTQLDGLRAQYAGMQALLETRTSELKGAQTFLTTADSLSGAEVTTMVEGLNSEILQTAAFIADSFEFEPMKAHQGGALDAAHKTVQDWIGAKTLHLLTSTRHSEDPMLIQIAVQSCLVRYSKDIITTWCFSMISERFLLQVYERMRQTGQSP